MNTVEAPVELLEEAAEAFAALGMFDKVEEVNVVLDGLQEREEDDSWLQMKDDQERSMFHEGDDNE